MTPEDLLKNETPQLPEPLCLHKYVIRHDLDFNMYYQCVNCLKQVYYWSEEARRFPWPTS